MNRFNIHHVILFMLLVNTATFANSATLSCNYFAVQHKLISRDNTNEFISLLNAEMLGTKKITAENLASELIHPISKRINKIFMGSEEIQIKYLLEARLNMLGHKIDVSELIPKLVESMSLSAVPIKLSKVESIIGDSQSIHDANLAHDVSLLHARDYPGLADASNQKIGIQSIRNWTKLIGELGVFVLDQNGFLFHDVAHLIDFHLHPGKEKLIRDFYVELNNVFNQLDHQSANVVFESFNNLANFVTEYMDFPSAEAINYFKDNPNLTLEEFQISVLNNSKNFYQFIDSHGGVMYDFLNYSNFKRVYNFSLEKIYYQYQSMIWNNTHSEKHALKLFNAMKFSAEKDFSYDVMVKEFTNDLRNRKIPMGESSTMRKYLENIVSNEDINILSELMRVELKKIGFQ